MQIEAQIVNEWKQKKALMIYRSISSTDNMCKNVFLKKKKTSAYIPTTSKNHSADKHKEKHT